MALAACNTRARRPRPGDGFSGPNSVDVLFIAPKALYRGWPFSNDFTRRIFATPSAAFPQLAGALADRRTGFLDGLFEPMSTERYFRRATAAPIVALSVVAPTLALNTELNIRLLRQRNPAAKIILGGHHPTFFAAEWLEKGADFVVRGEGETTFPRLVRAVLDGGDPDGIPGVSFRADGAVRHNPDAPVVANLDDLPWPDWSIVNWDLYDLGLRPAGRSAVVETSRGCPHRCIFCCAAEFWRHTQRFKSVDRVVEEIARLAASGVRQLMIADDNFGASLARDTAIFEALIRRNLDLSIWSFLRADVAVQHPDFVDLAARAGLRFVCVGFEALNDTTLDAYGKKLRGGMTVRDFSAAYRALKRRGMFVYGTLVRHYTLDQEETPLSWRAARRISDITAQNRFIPMRGTLAADQLAAAGYQLKDIFYHDRLLPAYERNGKRQSSKFVLTEILDLIHPANFAKLLFGSYVERRFFRNLYRGLLKDVLHFRPLSAKVLLAANDRRMSLDERQKRIVGLVFRAFNVDRPPADRSTSSGIP